MKIVDIANELFLETGEPDDTSIPAIAFWLRTNVGKLNVIIYEDFLINTSTLEIVDTSGAEIPLLAVAIMKTMYKVYRIELDIRANLTAINNNGIIAASDEGFSIKRINRSELLKTLTTLKKDTLEELTNLMHNYRSLKGAPSQVAGDDIEKGVYPHNYSAFERTY